MIDRCETKMIKRSAMDEVWDLIIDYRTKHNRRPDSLTVPDPLYLAAYREIARMTANARGTGLDDIPHDPPAGGFVLYGVKIERK